MNCCVVRLRETENWKLLSRSSSSIGDSGSSVIGSGSFSLSWLVWFPFDWLFPLLLLLLVLLVSSSFVSGLAGWFGCWSPSEGSGVDGTSSASWSSVSSVPLSVSSSSVCPSSVGRSTSFTTWLPFLFRPAPLLLGGLHLFVLEEYQVAPLSCQLLRKRPVGGHPLSIVHDFLVVHRWFPYK